jgi:hypothetical protein
MKLVKTIPHLGGLPEIFVFYCSRCKQAETKEQVVWQEASVRGWGLANRDAATASRSAPRGPRAAVVSIPACVRGDTGGGKKGRGASGWFQPGGGELLTLAGGLRTTFADVISSRSGTAGGAYAPIKCRSHRTLRTRRWGKRNSSAAHGGQG